MRKGIDCKGNKWEEIPLSKRMVNATGIRFGKLIPIFPVISNGKKQWLCQCDCGNQTVAFYAYLNAQKIQSCGCLRKEFSRNYFENKRNNENLIGKKYGRLTVVDFVGLINGDAIYHFKCDCGNEINVPITKVKNGNTNSCGCLQKERTKQYWQKYREENNFVNQTFGELTTLKFLRVENGEAIYLFKCSCGKEVEYPMHRVKSGNTSSCGHLWANWNNCTKTDIIGKRFDKLVVQEYVGIDKNGCTLFKCNCDCGNDTILPRYSLIGYRTHSCGCIVSVGESNIKKVLDEANIKYKPQQTFEDLLSDCNKKLQYDFGILDNNGQIIRLIEFDGVQHDKPINYFGGEKRFNQQKRYDSLKNQYALSHNIPLVRIPYDKRDSIILDDLLGFKYLMKG